MRVAWLALVAGCGTVAPDPFVIETTDCSLVNNFMIGGQPSRWDRCRVYWSGSPESILTVELALPMTSGSFLIPGIGWIRASAYVPGGAFNGELRSFQHDPQNTLPATLGVDQLALDMPIATCGNLGAIGLMVPTMADVGALSVSFSMDLPPHTCFRSGGSLDVGGGFIISATASAPAAADPATMVTFP
jgi:hypothetical protein